MAKKWVNPYLFFGCWVAGVAACASIAAYVFMETSPLASYCVGICIAGAIMMGLDKSLARSGSLRAPEKILFLVALLGGGPGILIGMHAFRHKTKKVAFQCALMLIFMVQFFIAEQLGVRFRE